MTGIITSSRRRTLGIGRDCRRHLFGEGFEQLGDEAKGAGLLLWIERGSAELWNTPFLRCLRCSEKADPCRLPQLELVRALRLSSSFVALRSSWCLFCTAATASGESRSSEMHSAAL